MALTLRRTVARAAEASNRRRLAAQHGRAAVLMYHRVLTDHESDEGIEPGMFVRASTFARHLEWLSQVATVVTLRSLLEEPPADNEGPRVAITFDDGWRDNLTIAWPILERAGLRATVFLVRNWVRDGRNASGEFIKPDEVRDLASRGMEFGAHTASHPALDRLPGAESRREMIESRDAVAAWTGSPCRHFAYPFGRYDEATLDASRALFEAAVVVGGGWWRRGGDPARIPRIGMHEDMTSDRAMLLARLAGAS